jgi:23S rRNA (cytidine1920-2'-O)/16S rRNA (cytidine1409-2'-O)-methyltransferase
VRLDLYLVENGFVDSRNKAQSIIKDSKVIINDKTIKKPSYIVSDDDKIVVDIDKIYVSRAALKLKEFLLENPIDIENKVCLDIGSSTGGFSQILLENSANSVTCVDVGSDQLHDTIRDDSRVKVYENTDIRKFESNEKFDIVTSDVSFISILNIVDDIDRLSSENIIILFKPQFEVGVEVKRDRNGVVKDQKAIEKSMALFRERVYKLGWQEILHTESKVHGKDGNREFFFYFKK